METTTKSPLQIALKYGVILGLANCVISLVFYILGMEFSKIPQNLGIAAGILMIILGIKAHKDSDLGGEISYGRALGTGTLVALFGAIVAAVYTLIFIKFIDTGFVEKLWQNQEEEMLKQGLSDDKIEMSMKYMKMFTTPLWMTIWVIVIGVFWGFITSLIVSIFLIAKKFTTVHWVLLSAIVIIFLIILYFSFGSPDTAYIQLK